MRLLTRWLPAGLARRFSLAAGGLAAVALLLASAASWWLIRQQHDEALHELAARERSFRATAVGSDLKALAARMNEIASSTILATGLVDSAGRETYLVPFLGGVRQINGVPVQVLFADFQGQEIASNGRAHFTAEQRAWLVQQLQQGRPGSVIFTTPNGPELVAMEPLIYSRTPSPEGAVLYKIQLNDLKLGAGMQLLWGEGSAAAPAAEPVPVPAAFQGLNFRVTGEARGNGPMRLSPPVLHIGLITLVMFAVVVVAGVRLATVLTRDLQRLEAFARRLEGSGLSAERAPHSGSDEVASLGVSINRMLDGLNAQHDALLAEREKLTQLTEALRAADRRKDDFLAMLAHELRNPLAPISTGAELLSRLPGLDPRAVRTSEVIARQASHMTKIVADLLDVSRVTRGLVTLDLAEHEVGDIVNVAAEQVRPMIEQRHHALQLHVPSERIVVRGDRARLVQVVSNLLNNAAKYTPDGGRIRLAVHGDAQTVRIEVQDNGIGIASELLPEVFDLFTQGSRDADRAQGGLGLGLALVKHLVELHGGQVAASSEGPGRGALLTVTLPRVTAPLAAEPAGPRANVRTQPLQLLVVDDNVDAARTLAAWLEMEGHSVRVAHDGPAALAQVAAQAPQACILDIGLPGMDGWQLARRLRALPATEGAVLVALSGYGQPGDRERSREAGFDHHLVKPADPARLRELLAAAAAARPSEPVA